MAHDALVAHVGLEIGMSPQEVSDCHLDGLRDFRPLRKISVSELVKVPGSASLMTLGSVRAYHSFGGEVEASSTSTIRRLTPSRRHQLPRTAPGLLRSAISHLCFDHERLGDHPGQPSGSIIKALFFAIAHLPSKLPNLLRKLLDIQRQFSELFFQLA